VRSPALVVAGNTFREVGRDRMLHLLGALVTGFVIFSWVLGWLNPEETDRERTLVDFGLGAVNVFGLLMAVLLGSSLLRREMERRTLYTVLSREVTRTQFVVGKYLGLLGVFAAGLGAVVVVMVLYFSIFGAVPGLPLAEAVYGNLLEIAVLTAAAVLLGSFTTPALSAIGTVCLWIVGHNTETLLEYLDQTRNDALEVPFKSLYYAFPNLTNFNYRLAASFGDPVPPEVLGLATLYAGVWVALLLGAAALLFRRRELP
jgi:ABC-type transport system involved in multi-copper enzyme maturation permease subunit